MNKFFLCLLLFFLAPLHAPAQQSTGLPSVQFTNGQWFDGSRFRPHTWYSVKGLLHPNRPFSIVDTVDLKGGFVVPACAEAHNHNAVGDNPKAIEAYLSAGILYVENPNNLPKLRTGGRINTPDGVDVIFANGGLTSPGGHPIGLVERNITRGVMTPEDGEGAFYYTVADPKDLERKWPLLLATHPDFVKSYLVYSEEFQTRKDDPKYFSRRGLDPSLMPLIVSKAKKARLRTVSHVESAHDFHVAVAAGVDQIAHMPGFWPSDESIANRNFDRYRIAEADARLAGKKHIQVVTTLSESLELMRDPKLKDSAAALMDVYRHNLALLRKYKVRILVGSDDFRANSATEALELVQAGLMSPSEILRAWCETTPQAIFPDRKIGKIKDGYEANFVVFPSDPLKDFTAIKNVSMRFKHGSEIKP
jgi:hypothetical protein